jgi:hypothetical protein
MLGFKAVRSLGILQFYTADQGTLKYTSSSAAINGGVLEVLKVSEAGSVNELCAVNNSGMFVFLMKGSGLFPFCSGEEGEREGTRIRNWQLPSSRETRSRSLTAMRTRIETTLPIVALAVRACLMLDWRSFRNSLMMARLQSTFSLVEVTSED